MYCSSMDTKGRDCQRFAGLLREQVEEAFHAHAVDVVIAGHKCVASLTWPPHLSRDARNNTRTRTRTPTPHPQTQLRALPARVPQPAHLHLQLLLRLTRCPHLHRQRRSRQPRGQRRGATLQQGHFALVCKGEGGAERRRRVSDCCGGVLWCCGVVRLWRAIVYMHACELTRVRCSYGRMSIGGRQLRWQYVESASGDVVDEFVLTK